MKETFQTPGHVSLDVRLPEGEVRLETGAGGETVVELSGLPEDDLRQIARVAVRERGGAYEVRVEIEDRHGWERFFKSRNVRIDVVAPEGADVHVRGGSADVDGRGRFGALAVSTGSGDITFEEAAGDADLKSGSGDIRVREVSGNAAVATGSGDVDFERVGGTAQVRSASGDVHIGESGADVTVQTASGDQRLDEVVQGEVLLQSASGDMTVGIRRGSRIAVDARSLSGDTSSEIGLDDFEVDGGGDGPFVELRATTMSGDVRVVRA